MPSFSALVRPTPDASSLGAGSTMAMKMHGVVPRYFAVIRQAHSLASGWYLRYADGLRSFPYASDPSRCPPFNGST